MKNKIEVGGLKLWLNNNIIYCKITNSFNKNGANEPIDKILSDIISVESKGEYMPMLIDIREVNFFHSIKLFRFLSHSDHLKASVLSKTFLVNSFLLKILLFIQSYLINPIAPDTIFCNCVMSVRYCKKNYMMFNSLG